ncbi:hypothetical protein KP509_03G037800 [Ceratopteris richardii]|nr:hypothetical protein KP509_03G037800 [Ceratopteris richardii]
MCAVRDEPALTRFKVFGEIPSVDLTFSSKKWRIIKSFISGNSEENVASSKYVSESSMVPVVELKWSNDSLFDDGSPATHLKLELFSNFMSLLVHSEGEESSESIIILLMKGENASLLFLDSDIKQKLEFHISSLHIQKPSKESNPFPFLSLHSTGNLAISGLFLPNPIWSWELKASEMVAVVRGVCSHPEEVVAVNVKGLRHSGTWKSGRMDAMHLKAAYAKIMADNILLERTIEHSDCHLCLTNLACIMSGIEQQQCSEILALIASEALHGVEIDILSLEKNRNVYISMPFLNLRVHFANWRLFLRVLNSYSFLRSDDNKNECNSIPMLSTADAQQKENSIVSSDHNTLACIMIQSSLMSININLPNHSIEFYDKFTSDSRMSSVAENDVLSEKGYFSSISKQSSAISCNIALQVKNLCYRESLCNFESSIVKCEVRAIDCFPGDAQSIPLLQATGIEVKSSLEVSSSNKKSITMHLSVVKRLDIWCSPTVIHFLRCFKFEDGPHAASNIELEVACIMISLERGSLLLTDGGWNYNAPIFELRMKNLNSEITWSCPDQLSATTRMLLEADYHDMEKVAWEPFLEPWDLLCHLACSGTNIPFQQADLKFSSADNMNVNITKAFFQASARAVDLFSATGSSRETFSVSKTQSIVGYAPYWLQNDTGIRLKYWLVGASKLDDIDCFVDDSESEWLSQNIVDTGSSVPINIQETPEQVFHSGRLNSSSERLFDRSSYNGKHRLIRIQLEGTASASCVLSMDLVGLNIFYVTFSHSSNDLLDSKKRKEKQKIDAKVGGDHVEVEVESSAFQMPVVYEVSSHCYSKVIRIYSTVSLVNATTIPMEVRFDIPFGVVPKVMEPILPGEVIPLPVHLAETGQIRWKPMGNSHLWSETQSLSHIFSASKLGSLRAFVSYPSNPSDAIFRCCVMVQENESSKSSISAILKQSYSSMTSSVDTRISSFPPSFLTGSRSDSSSPGAVPIVRELVFEAPFVFKNCLPLPLSLIINSSAGHELTCRVPECDTIFVLEVNTAHDLALTINVPGFLSASLVLESTTNLVEQHKNDIQNKFSLTRTICLLPDNIHGYSVYCKTESSFNLMSGAREICISVPFWFYNHTGVTLGIVDGDADVHKKNHHQVMQQLIPDFSLFDQELGCFDTESVGLNTVLSEPALSTNRLFTHGHFCGTTNMRSVGGGKKIISCIPSRYSSSAIENSTKGVHGSKPFVYSPMSDTELGDNRLRARVALPCSGKGALTSHANKFSWSRPFSLNPPGGMTSIVLPVSEEEGGYIVSVVSAPVLGACAGKTRTITFQPRFVLVNACSHDLCYRQQGIDRFQYLMKGEQAHLYWSDMSKPLLVSLRLEQQGWDWSGAFVPDQLGDTQLKMRNMGTGTTQILRVEVQNAGSFQHASNAMPSTDNSLGTFLLLISDDESGFMPYRIENFSLERLRFFQSKCPDFESTLLPYSSCLYAWDEPWRPHQLVVEVPGEGCLGSFDLDDVRDYPVVHIPARNQKPERWFSICVYAEGPTRVLSLQDVHLHPKENLCGRNLKGPFPKHTDEYTGGTFSFNFSFASLGISVMNTFPQEILFATAQDVMITLSRNPHEENLSINISYIQFDNQLPHAQYPVMFLSGICDQNELSNLKEGKRGDSPASGEFFLEQLAFTLAVSKWRHHTSSVECFQKIHARMAPSQVQLDEQIVNCLVEFCRTTRDAGFHPDYHDYDGEIKFSSGREIFLNHRYMLTLDRKSTKFRLLRILKFEDIYKCWPVAEAVNFLRGQTSKDLLLASGGRKVYIESLLIGPIELTVSFSSIPWREAAHSQNISEESAPFMQQSLLALLDIEEAPVQLGQLFFAHPLARWDAIRGMVIRHYTRQLLHEIYKVLGSVGLLGNPMGFMKSLGLGVREFVSAPAKSFVQSPRQLVGGFAEGTQSLVSNTVFAVSNAATLISRAAKKGVTSLAPGHQQQIGFQDYGVISELLEGLTGLLQSPVTGAARHGLPGILSGVAVGAVGLFARPIASILEAAGRTAQSIRSWSQPIQQAQRIRPPRYLNRGSPIFPYSWEEAVGNAVLLEAAGSCLQNEVYVTCRPLSELGKYAVLTERILLIVKSSATAHGGRPHWIILSKISLDDVLHVERNEKILNILMGSPRCPSGIHGLKKKQLLPYKRDSSTSPLLHESFTMPKEIDAEELSLYIRNVLDRRTKSRTNYIKL